MVQLEFTRSYRYVEAHYVCSACWGDLHVDPVTYQATCDTQGCTTPGMIKEGTKNIYKQRQINDLREVQEALDIVPVPVKSGKTADQLLKELGF